MDEEHAILLHDALVMTAFTIAEERIPYRVIYDMGWIVKNPTEFIIAVDALVELNEVVNDFYQREPNIEAPEHSPSYFEAEDGDPAWLDEGEQGISDST